MDYKKLGDLYELLGISPHADADLIKAAWKVQLTKCHPDRTGGSADLSMRINEAKGILLDEKRRKEYDDARGALIGNYRVIRQIGEGGLGRTYEARHVTLDEKACLKQNINISAEDAEIMTREAKVLWHLHHYSLPTLKDYFRMPDGSVVIAMTFVEGKNLEQIVEKQKAVEPEHACWIAQRLLNALNYLHFHGVIHGDVKPQNVIVQPKDHNAFLVDYGFATINPTRHSAAGGYTPAFVAPEILAGCPPTPESDIYSLGSTMIYTLGGNPMAAACPDKIPKPIREYFGSFMLHNPKARPNWEKADLVKELSDIRQAVFGRRSSNKELKI